MVHENMGGVYIEAPRSEAFLIPTHSILFYGEVRKQTILLVEKKIFIYSYMKVKPYLRPVL